MLSKIQQSTIISRITSEVFKVFTGNYQNQEDSTLEFAQEKDEDGLVEITEQATSTVEKTIDELTKQSPIIKSTFNLDTNDDGIITPEEIENQLETNSVAGIFKNEDGTLDDAMILTLGVAGGISQEELTDKLRDIDTYKDGIISDEEIDAIKNSEEYIKQQQKFEDIETDAKNISNLITGFFENKNNLNQQ